VSCSKKKYDPDTYYSPKEQDSLVYSLIRYCAKPPSAATHDTKFNEQYDTYYRTVAEDWDIRAYYVDDDSTHFFLLTKPARSITPMREAIGGKMKVSHAALVSYEEVFRTWKMPEEKLNERFVILFDKMVKHESLAPYYPKNAGDQYIEFPDDRFYFDKTKRRWRDKLFDSLKIDSY
jgi:hypothetical protein